MTEFKLDHPHAGTRAAEMLDVAIDQMGKNGRGSLRHIAGVLGYKSAVILSHMRSGRLPIPIDRAIDIANATQMDAGAFLLAVLEQRHSDIDFLKMLTGRDAKQDPAAHPMGMDLADTLSQALDQPLKSLSSEQVGVIREIIADPHPRRRWASISEASIIDFVRRDLPEIARDGLSAVQRDALKKALVDS